jgi:hypothetical protein
VILSISFKVSMLKCGKNDETLLRLSEKNNNDWDVPRV